ncbi:phage holin [uncultured Bifidobacterium sp.]|uniref:phage holin n=1 Tax=uncultured Bifidobacterium sp. TaxID=165187 RepID=UPI00258479C5|nr:phage holin [uncultured Bifidobacterium sp.]
MRYIIPDRIYQLLKWLGLVVIPATATLVGAVGTAWGWPHLAAIVTTITALGAFIGALVGVSAATGKPAENTETSRENSLKR